MYSPSERETRIYGRAVTVKMVEMNSSGPKPSVHFADCNKAGHIMYIQQPKGMNSACWGGLMSTRANKVGGCGVIVDGRIRDIQEHKDLNFPVSDYFTCLVWIPSQIWTIGLCSEHLYFGLWLVHKSIGDQRFPPVQRGALGAPR